MLFKIGKQFLFLDCTVQQCSSAVWKKGKISFMISARRELIHRPLSLHRTTDRSSLSPSLSPVLSALLHQLSFRTKLFSGGLTLRIVPSLRSLAVSGGVLNHAETALVLQLPPPKCFPCARTCTRNTQEA